MIPNKQKDHWKNIKATCHLPKNNDGINPFKVWLIDHSTLFPINAFDSKNNAAVINVFPGSERRYDMMKAEMTKKQETVKELDLYRCLLNAVAGQ